MIYDKSIVEQNISYIIYTYLLKYITYIIKKHSNGINNKLEINKYSFFHNQKQNIFKLVDTNRTTINQKQIKIEPFKSHEINKTERKLNRA